MRRHWIPVDEVPTYRLIACGSSDEPLLSTEIEFSLTEFAAFNRLTNLTTVAANRRVLAVKRNSGLQQLPDAESTHINQTFARSKKRPSRFNDRYRGAWYCSLPFNADGQLGLLPPEQTAIEEVAFHMLRALRHTQIGSITIDYRTVLSDVRGFRFFDLRNVGLPNLRACLDPNPRHGYRYGQALARDLRRSSVRANGIKFQSVRHADGTCLAVFHPGCIHDVRFGDTWTLQFN